MATLGWWAFAFLPLPTAPPAWLTAARYACFGAVDTGLPELHGWILLTLAPLSFLVAIAALWGGELLALVRRAVRSPVGLPLVVALLVAVGVEGAWVSTKVRAARVVADWDAALADAPASLPAEYPRQAAVAPDFTLVDQHGQKVSRTSFEGRPVVVAFVFAHCQTLCPLVVEAIKTGSRDSVPPSEVVLVTLDPWRDTPEALPGLAERWQLPPNFHVVSGKRVADVLDVARAYGVPFERNEQTGDIVHPGLVFLIDSHGRIAYMFNSPPAAWIHDGLDRLG